MLRRVARNSLHILIIPRFKVGSSGLASKNNDLSTFMLRHAKGRRVLNAGPGMVIFSQGDEADAVFYLAKGAVKAIVASRAGKEAIVNVFTDKQFFGCTTLTRDGHNRSYTAVAL